MRRKKVDKISKCEPDFKGKRPHFLVSWTPAASCRGLDTQGRALTSSVRAELLVSNSNTSLPGSQRDWHAWLKCLDYRVMQLLYWLQRRALNHKPVIIAPRFIFCVDLPHPPSISLPLNPPPPPLPIAVCVCGPRKHISTHPVSRVYV